MNLAKGLSVLLIFSKTNFNFIDFFFFFLFAVVYFISTGNFIIPSILGASQVAQW